jgi:ankyrin repeat protein
MTQSSNLISQELNVLFSKFMCLSKIEPDKENELKRKDNLIELSKDEKFIQLMRGLIGKDKEMEKKLKDKINEEEKKKKLIRRKYLLKKFKEIILNACQKIKKYNIDIDIFYSLMEINKNDETFKKEYVNKGQYLFRVIKAGDINEIINVINQNNYLVSYKDEFDQIPLHICAKRNIYQIIAFLLSRLSPIDAQDESGRTALMIAAHYNYLEFVTILLFENANPKIKDINLKKASDLTTNEKIKIILKRAEALHNLHLFIEGKNLQKFVVNGLDFLYKKELEINYEKWINQGIKIVKDSQQSFI